MDKERAERMFGNDKPQQVRLTGGQVGDGLAMQDARSECMECGKAISWVPYRGAGCQTIHEACYQRVVAPYVGGYWAKV